MFKLYVCAAVVCETIFVYNAVAYAERQRLATMMGMQSTPRLTPMLHWSYSGPGLPPGSALHWKYHKDPKLFALKVCLLGNFILCIYVCTNFMTCLTCRLLTSCCVQFLIAVAAVSLPYIP